MKHLKFYTPVFKKKLAQGYGVATWFPPCSPGLDYNVVSEMP
jgi:hypothetical protein